MESQNSLLFIGAVKNMLSLKKKIKKNCIAHPQKRNKGGDDDLIFIYFFYLLFAYWGLSSGSTT
jgi:hypothetical protein